MRGAARTRTHTYTELGGMTRRLPAGQDLLYLGGWAHDHLVRFCTMPRTPRWRWPPWFLRPLGLPAVDLSPQRVKGLSHVAVTTAGPARVSALLPFLWFHDCPK